MCTSTVGASSPDAAPPARCSRVSVGVVRQVGFAAINAVSVAARGHPGRCAIPCLPAPRRVRTCVDGRPPAHVHDHHVHAAVGRRRAGRRVHLQRTPITARPVSHVWARAHTRACIHVLCIHSSNSTQQVAPCASHRPVPIQSTRRAAALPAAPAVARGPCWLSARPAGGCRAQSQSQRRSPAPAGQPAAHSWAAPGRPMGGAAETHTRHGLMRQHCISQQPQ